MDILFRTSHRTDAGMIIPRGVAQLMHLQGKRHWPLGGVNDRRGPVYSIRDVRIEDSGCGLHSQIRLGVGVALAL